MLLQKSSSSELHSYVLLVATAGGGSYCRCTTLLQSIRNPLGNLEGSIVLERMLPDSVIAQQNSR